MGELDEILETAEELWEGAPCGYVSSRPDGIILRVNRTFLRWTGYRREELLGRKRLQELLTVGGQVFYETHLGPLLRMQGAVNEIQLEIVCADGRPLPVLLNAAQRTNAAGEPVLVRSTVFDITDRKRYERELLRSEKSAERRARRAALGVEIGHALTRRSEVAAQMQLCADAVVEHLDAVEVRIWIATPAADGLRLVASAGVHSTGPEPRPAHPPAREARAASERRPVVLHGAEQLAPAGEEGWLRREGVASAAALPLLARDRVLGVLAVYGREAIDAELEQALGTVSSELAVAVDRTWAERERDDLLERLQLQTQELRTAQHRLSTVVRNAPLILFSLDVEGRILVSQGKGLSALGIHDPAARTGLSAFEVYAHVPWLVEELRRAVAGESFVGGGKLGGVIYETHYTPTVDEDGAPSGTVGLALDVTERKRYEDAIHKTVEFEQQLLGIVSHDLRNPVSAILLGASLLLGKGDALDDQTLRTVARIRSSGERAQRLIHDLLDFTQARLGGGIRIERARVDLSEVVREAIEEVEAGHTHRSVSLEARGDFHGEWDPDRLAQVVTNLVVNALKYSPPATSVRVVLRDHGETVSMSVHNEGTPIPAETLGLLFLPMRRAISGIDKTGRSVGLGLYIVKQIVDAHRGNIEVQSDASWGTVFEVVLPRWSNRPPAPGSGG